MVSSNGYRVRDHGTHLVTNSGEVDEALNTVTILESAIYDVFESKYVQKAEIDEECRETRLQGLKIAS